MCEIETWCVSSVWYKDDANIFILLIFIDLLLIHTDMKNHFSKWLAAQCKETRPILAVHIQQHLSHCS